MAADRPRQCSDNSACQETMRPGHGALSPVEKPRFSAMTTRRNQPSMKHEWKNNNRLRLLCWRGYCRQLWSVPRKGRCGCAAAGAQMRMPPLPPAPADPTRQRRRSRVQPRGVRPTRGRPAGAPGPLESHRLPCLPQAPRTHLWLHRTLPSDGRQRHERPLSVLQLVLRPIAWRLHRPRGASRTVHGSPRQMRGQLAPTPQCRRLRLHRQRRSSSASLRRRRRAEVTAGRRRARAEPQQRQ